MYMATTHTQTCYPVNMVPYIFSHYFSHAAPRRTTSPAASTSYGQQGRQTGQNCLLGCGSSRRQAAKLLLAFRSLDPFRALREPDRRRRDEEGPFPLRTKK